MQTSKSLLQQSIVVVVFAACAFALAIVVQNTTESGFAVPVEHAIALVKKEPVQAGLPMRLRIPSINVDAAIEHVGLVPGGVMGNPKKPEDTAWFELGPQPGEKGSAVVAGHYGWKNGRAAAFDSLHTLQKGDEIYVEDEAGTVTVFIVRELRTYAQHDDATDVFNSTDGNAHLNLITCGGVWDGVQKTYSNRTVVFTDKK